jgi:hypothetical protein
MRKLLAQPLDDWPRRRRSWTSIALAVLIVPLISPVLYESTVVCVSRWKALCGVPMTVETPVLDAIVSEWETVRLELHWVSRRYFHDMSWKPSYVIPIALSWTGVLALALRKC